MPTYAMGVPGAYPPGLSRGQVGYSFGATTAVAIAASPSGLVRALGGVVTLTTGANHNFSAGQYVSIQGETSVGGTRFGGLYLITATPTPTTATLTASDPIVQHQATDTGGAGTATSIAYETPTTGTSGKSFGFAARPVNASNFGFSVDLLFSGAPGAFEFDVQVAEIDIDAAYTTISGGNITTAGTNNTAHLDATFTGANFVRIKCVTQTGNAVGVLASIRG